MNEEEYTQIKISIPLIDDIELARIDNFYNDIVDEYTRAFVKEKEQVITQRLMMNLRKENQQLKEKINQYENPDDLTLFYMWLDEKVKDKIKKLQSTLEEIRTILNELYEFGEEWHWDNGCLEDYVKDLLQIIDKGE